MPRFENPPYYITAYGLAVKRGFKGTLDEWIASLKGEKGDQGDKVELRYLEDKIQWRWIPDAGATEDTAAEEDSGTEDTTEAKGSEDLKDDYEWHDLIDVAEIRGDIIEKTLDEANAAANQATAMASSASGAAGAAQSAANTATDAANTATGAMNQAAGHAASSRQSAQEAQTSADAAAASAAAAAETAKSVDADEIQKEIEKRGNNLWRDPATGLLYLMSGETKLGDGVEAGSGSGGLAFDSGYMDEEGYLHLTLQGEDIEGFEPFYVGTGGGGGGYGSTIKLTCGLDSRIFSIMAGEPSCVIPYTWTSTDTEDGTPTGNGSATWTVNGSRAAVQKVAQGENSFDIRKYLTDGEENAVILTISDAYGNSKNMPFTITVTAFGLSWYLEDMAYHKSEALTIRMDPIGAGDKLVKLSVDGTEVYSQNVSTTGRTISTTVGPLSHGAHTIEAWLEVEVEGETLTTEKLRHVGIWTAEGTTTKIVGVLTPELTVSQYGTAAVKFMVVDPASETASVELQVDGVTTSVLSDVDRSIQTWAYKARTVGTETLGVVCGTVSDTVELTVTSLGYDIAPVTAGLVLDIDPAGHSNTEAGRANFGYTDADGVNHPFTFSDNFDWTGGGFQLDADGVTAFVVKRGCYVTADCSLFADNAKTNGKEIKLIFKSENVRNSDAELLNCMSGKVGLKLQAQQATVGSEAESMSVLYYEGKKIEMDVNIQSTGENSLAYICLKGVPSAEPVQYGSTDSWTQTAPQLLTIYSSKSYFSTYMIDSELQRYAHWVAAWSKSCNYSGSGFGMWQYGGETNLIRSNKVAGVVCDQDYMLVDYPALIKKAGKNGFGDTAEETGADEAAGNEGQSENYTFVQAYSLSADGELHLTTNFQVKEFACKDGSDPVFIHPNLPNWCQAARDKFGYAFSPNSAYRTVSHNAKPDVGGSSRSYHIYGMAVDIPAKGNTTPQMLYNFFDKLLGDSGELGIYSWGVHVAVCKTKKRFKA